jgi:hypothetical protein
MVGHFDSIVWERGHGRAAAAGRWSVVAVDRVQTQMSVLGIGPREAQRVAGCPDLTATGPATYSYQSRRVVLMVGRWRGVCQWRWTTLLNKSFSRSSVDFVFPLWSLPLENSRPLDAEGPEKTSDMCRSSRVSLRLQKRRKQKQEARFVECSAPEARSCEIRPLARRRQRIPEQGSGRTAAAQQERGKERTIRKWVRRERGLTRLRGAGDNHRRQVLLRDADFPE